jgi:hypothetical protein
VLTVNVLDPLLIELAVTALAFSITPPILFDEAVGVVKLLDLVLPLLLMLVPPERAPLIANVDTPDTAVLLIATPPILFDEAVGVVKLADCVLPELLMLVPPERAPLIANVVTPVIAPPAARPPPDEIKPDVETVGPVNPPDVAIEPLALMLVTPLTAPLFSVTPPIELDPEAALIVPTADMFLVSGSMPIPLIVFAAGPVNPPDRINPDADTVGPVNPTEVAMYPLVFSVPTADMFLVSGSMPIPLIVFAAGPVNPPE